MKKIAHAVLCTLFFISSATSQDYNFNINTIPENLKENANSVIRFENVAIEMKSQRDMIIKVEKAITIFNKLAEDYEDVLLHYDKRRTIKNVTVFIYDSTGEQLKKIKKSEFKDYSAYDGFSLYNDGRLLYYDYTPISYPYTIYYKYEVKTSNTAFIRRWIPIKSYSQSIEQSKYSFKYPIGVTLRKSEKNFEGLSVASNEFNGMLNYEVKDIPAVKHESYAPFF